MAYDRFAPCVIHKEKNVHKKQKRWKREDALNRHKKVYESNFPARRWSRLGTKALREIHKFKKSTELLIPKMPFLQLVKEVLQWEHGDHHIQARAVLVLHEATEAYIMQLLEDTNLCVVHAKCITILPRDMELAR